jgi:RluA family pseudouridine synthase
MIDFAYSKGLTFFNEFRNCDNMLKVLFEDEYFIVVEKPCGIPTAPTLDRKRENLFSIVQKFLGPGAYVGLHHRLDKDTSGIVLFTKTPEVNKAVTEMFQKHSIQKTYWAVCQKISQAEARAWTVKNHLRSKKDRVLKIQKTVAVKSGGDYAETDFQILQSGTSLHLIEARPKTGRTHQIRVHLADSGWPIAGDPLYSDDSRKFTRLYLHATKIQFKHPVTTQSISIESAPQEFQKLAGT